MGITTRLTDINTLHNVYVAEELIQLTVISDAEIIANSNWTEDLLAANTLKAAASVH